MAKGIAEVEKEEAKKMIHRRVENDPETSTTRSKIVEKGGGRLKYAFEYMDIMRGCWQG